MKNTIKKLGISFLVGAIMATSIPNFANEVEKTTFLTETYAIHESKSSKDLYLLLEDIVIDFSIGLGYNANPEDYSKIVPFVDFNPQNYSRLFSLFKDLEKQSEKVPWKSELDKKMFLEQIKYYKTSYQNTCLPFEEAYYALTYIFNRDLSKLSEYSKKEWDYYYHNEESGVIFVNQMVQQVDTIMLKDKALPYFITPVYFYSLLNLKEDLTTATFDLKAYIQEIESPKLKILRAAYFSEGQSRSQIQNLNTILEGMEHILAQTEASIKHHEAQGTNRINKEIYANTLIPLIVGEAMSPETIFNIGKKEVNRIQIELIKKLREMGYQGSLRDQIIQFKADAILYEIDDALPIFKQIMVDLQNSLHKYFYVGTYPAHLPEITPVEGANSFYSIMDSQGEMKGQFKPATAAHPDYLIETLTVHETIPGHHLERQSAYNIRHKSLENQNMSFTSFTEGWALYTERLAREEGLIKTDKGYIGSLLFELLRAGRLVADVGINYYDWSDDKAITYLTQETFYIHPEAEVYRYNIWPSQALSYKLGELKFLETRENLKKRLGKSFNLMDFHYEMLEYPSVPLHLFEDLVADLKP